MRQRYLSLSLLLFLVLLAVVITLAVAGGDDKKETTSEEKGTEEKKENKDNGDKKNEETNKSPPSSSSTEPITDMGPCDDAGKSQYVVDNADIRHQKEFNQKIVDFAVAYGKANKDSKIELLEVNTVAQRPGCGIYYDMTIEMRDKKLYNCEYFYSNYEGHLEYCNLTTSKTTTKQEGSDVNKCQDPSKNKYEEVKDPSSAIFFANLAVLEYNSKVVSSGGDVNVIDKIKEAKRRPGCGTYYRVFLHCNDRTGNEFQQFETEVYEAGDLRHIVYFRKE